MADKRLVISTFDAEATAAEAAEALQRTGAVVDDAMAILVLDEHGELKTHKIGATTGVKGAGAGLLLGILGPIGIGVGTVGGAILGHRHHKGVGLGDADRERLTTALRGGKAALAVLADADELVAVQSFVADRGGTTESHELDEAILREAQAGAATDRPS
ncbi:MAG: DUF1269 domain-containing protein [Solirubrobacterales bacterium]|nr:DUF1269 domain-containing protein [Solirubrobacterales bacterium]